MRLALHAIGNGTSVFFNHVWFLCHFVNRVTHKIQLFLSFFFSSLIFLPPPLSLLCACLHTYVCTLSTSKSLLQTPPYQDTSLRAEFFIRTLNRTGRFSRTHHWGQVGHTYVSLASSGHSIGQTPQIKGQWSKIKWSSHPLREGGHTMSIKGNT